VRLPNNQKIATQNPFLPREIVAFLPCSSILVLFLLFFRIFSHPVLFIFAPHNVFKIKLVSPFGQHDTFTFHFEQGRELKIKNHFSPKLSGAEWGGWTSSMISTWYLVKRFHASISSRKFHMCLCEILYVDYISGFILLKILSHRIAMQG